MEFFETIEFLKKRFDRGLPGQKAQLRTSPEDVPDRNTMAAGKPDARRGGVLILLYPSEGSTVSFPLIQRHEYEGVHGNQVGLPGGKREKGDKDIIATALRETWEEVGVSQKDVRIFGPLTELYIPPSNIRVTPVLGYLEYTPEFRIDTYEVRELLLVRLSQLLHRDTLKSTNMVVRGRELNNVPYYFLNKKVVWGATAMILSEVVDLFKTKSNSII